MKKFRTKILPERVVAHGVRIDGAEAALGGIGRAPAEFRLRHAAQVEDLRVRQTRAGDAVEAVDLMIGAVVRVGRVGEEHEHVAAPVALPADLDADFFDGKFFPLLLCLFFA